MLTCQSYDRYRRLAKRYEEATATGATNDTALQTPFKKRGRKHTKEKEDQTHAAEDDNVKCEDPDHVVAESAKKKAKTEDSNGA